ncbi:MAG: hypothetical protein H6679_05325 [Epsilonproteobacteria bacterium]|nr:hypothetical protein [Campylobacterota bacterium]
MIKKMYVIALLSASMLWVCAQAKVDDSYITAKVQREVSKQIKADAKKEKKVYTNRVKADDKGVYLLPNIPHYSYFFRKGDLVSLWYSFEHASQMYNSDGRTRDLSHLQFGECPVRIQDILLSSKLANTPRAATGAGNLKSKHFDLPMAKPDAATVARELQRGEYFLSLLADQELVFDAKQHSHQFSIDYIRSFHGGDINVGFHIPIKAINHKLRLKNCIDSDKRKKIEDIERANPLPGGDNVQFFSKYCDLEGFLEEILRRKCMCFNKKSGLVGLGDAMGYVNFNFTGKHIDRFILGFSVQMPTAHERNADNLWQIDFGNGGFTELSAFITSMWELRRWLNPYVHIRGTYSTDARVNRRVPSIKEFDGTAAGGGGKFAAFTNDPATNLVFGENVMYRVADAVKFSLPDSTARNFADGAHRIKIHRGGELFMRIGNSFARVFSSRLFFDIFYDLDLRGRDYKASNDSRCKKLCPDILMCHTWSTKHKISGSMAYQFDDGVRLFLGGNYVFAGRNAPKSFGVDAVLNVEF